MKVKIPCHQAVPVYKVLSEKIKELKALGLSNSDILAKYDPEHENCAYHPMQTAVKLLMECTGHSAHGSNFDIIEEMQTAMEKSLLQRFLYQIKLTF